MRIVLAIIVCLAVVPALAQQQPPLNAPPNQPDKQQTAPDRRGTEQVPFVVKEVPRDRSAEDTQQDAEKRELDREVAGYTKRIWLPIPKSCLSPRWRWRCLLACSLSSPSTRFEKDEKLPKPLRMPLGPPPIVPKPRPTSPKPPPITLDMPNRRSLLLKTMLKGNCALTCL